MRRKRKLEEVNELAYSLAQADNLSVASLMAADGMSYHVAYHWLKRFRSQVVVVGTVRGGGRGPKQLRYGLPKGVDNPLG
jgi:hypothetical protein